MTVTVLPDRLAELESGAIRLDHGAHESFEQGHCAMEVVSYLAGLGHTDAPQCASPVLRSYTIALNDRWDDTQRQALIPFLARMIGTADDGQDEARLRIAREALLIDLLPAWLSLAGMDDEIAPLAGLTDRDEIREALYRLRDRAWGKRRSALDALEAKVRERLAGKPVAVAVAAAGAVADAAADASAVASAVAVASAAASAAAVAGAAAAASAAAVAGAAAAASAAAAAGAAGKEVDWWDKRYDAAYRAAREAIKRSTDPVLVKVRELGERHQGLALDLLDRLIDPSAVAA